MTAPRKPSKELSDEERASLERLGRVASSLVGDVPDVDNLDQAALRSILERWNAARDVMAGAISLSESLPVKHAQSVAGLTRAEQLRSGKPERNAALRARRDELLAAGEAVGDILAKLQVQSGLSFKQLGRILE